MSMLMSTVIKNDHQEVYTKYHQLWALSAFDHAKNKVERKALVTDLIKLMTVHANVETEVLYPILNHLPKHGKQAATKAQAEHEEVELLLKQLQDMDADAPHFASTLKKALSMFKLHADDEEKHLLPEIDQHLQAQGGDVMQRTVAEYERAKKHVGHVPHPAISHSGQGKEVAEGLLKAAEDAARQTPESAHVFNVTTQGTAK